MIAPALLKLSGATALPLIGNDPIPHPSIEYAALSPMLIAFGVAILGVLIEAFAGAGVRARVQPFIAIGGLVASLVAVIVIGLHLNDVGAGHRRIIAATAVAMDGPALFLEGLLAALGIAGLLLVAERSVDSTGGALVADAAIVPGERGAGVALASQRVTTEAYPLMMFSIGGMMLFAAANTLLVSFIGLEVLSLPLYLLAGLARRRRLLSQEASVKYFLLGAFSSAFFLYGLALVYGYAGTVTLGGIATASQTAGKNDLLLYLGMGLLGVGLLFKLSAAPFHNWTPDVYQGSPTPITSFMAALTKVGAFGALLRIFYVSFGPLRADWRPIIFLIAILTMVVGAVVAITQTDIKRMLAYSSIAHAGFLLVGVAAANTAGISSVLFYLTTYGFTTIGAFAVVTLVRDGDGEATHLSKWQGLGKRDPLVAAAMVLFLLALAGIPLTSGFQAKFDVFEAASSGSATPLIIVGVVTSAVAAFFYGKVILLMFFSEPTADTATVAIPSWWTKSALLIAAVATLALGIVPGYLLHLTNVAGVFVR